VAATQSNNRDQERKEGERRNRVENADYAERPLHKAIVASGPDADEERDRERNGKRRDGDDDVLPQRDRDLVPVAQEPGHSPPASQAATASKSGARGRSSSRMATRARTPS